MLYDDNTLSFSPMRLSLTPALFLLLVACNPTPQDGTGTPETGSGSVVTEGALQGEFCGGIAAIECASGLVCQLEDTYPDAGGTCQAG